MDDLDEYLSLVQSLKTYYTPMMHLNLKIQEVSQSNKQSTSKPTPSAKVPVIPVTKFPEAQIISSHSPALSNIPSLVDNTLHTTIKKSLPGETFYEYLPSGISATKKLPSCDLPNVPIFFYKENPCDQKFLTNIISAIQDKFAKTSALIDIQEIEESNLWRSVTTMRHLDCIIVYDTWITTCLHGRCWYRTHLHTNNCFLGTIPLIVLSSKENWYRDNHNKKVLWNQLCRILKQPTQGRIMTK